MHGEDVVVEAVGVALVNHVVVEIRLQPVGRPALLRRPAAGVVLDRQPPRAAAAGRGHRVDQDVAVFGDGRLDDRAAFPLVVPQQLAVGGIDAHRSGRAEDHHLRDAVDRDEMRRAVAAAMQRSDPALLAGRGVVSGERAADADDHHIVDDRAASSRCPRTERRATCRSTCRATRSSCRSWHRARSGRRSRPSSRRDPCRSSACRAGPRRRSIRRNEPDRRDATPARPSRLDSTRRSPRCRAAPACRADRRAPRTTTSRARSAAATSAPAATPTNRC